MLKSFLIYLNFLFLVFSISDTNAQIECFKTKIQYISADLSKFSSAITTDANQLYFIANDYNLYCFDKNTFELKYKKELNSKSNTAPYSYKNTLIISKYEDKKHQAIILNKVTGETIQELNLSPLKSNPYFVNDTTFISTIIDDNGGQLVCYDLKNNILLWQHFIGHGADKPFYIQDESILANFDYDEWKIVTYDGKIIDEIVEEYGTNIKFKRHNIFFDLAHDKNEIKEDVLVNYFSNTENITIKTSANVTVLLNPKKLIVLSDDLKVISNVELQKALKQLEESDNDYLSILKIEPENVWLFYKNHLVNYNFKKNNFITTYDLTKWNTHQATLDEDTLWLISKNDGQLYGLQLEMTQKQLDEKIARMKHLECTQPDKARIKAEKLAKEKIN